MGPISLYNIKGKKEGIKLLVIDLLASNLVQDPQKQGDNAKQHIETSIHHKKIRNYQMNSTNYLVFKFFKFQRFNALFLPVNCVYSISWSLKIVKNVTLFINSINAKVTTVSI